MSTQYWEAIDEVKQLLANHKFIQAHELTQKIRQQFNSKFEQENDLLIFQKEILTYGAIEYLNFEIQQTPDLDKNLGLIFLLSSHKEYDHVWLKSHLETIEQSDSSYKDWANGIFSSLFAERALSKEIEFYHLLIEKNFIQEMDNRCFFNAIHKLNNPNEYTLEFLFNKNIELFYTCAYACLVTDEVIKSYLPIIENYTQQANLEQVSFIYNIDNLCQWAQQNIKDIKPLMIKDERKEQYVYRLEKRILQKKLNENLIAHKEYKINKI